MKDPFEGAESYYFEIPEQHLGESSVVIETEKDRFEYDKVSMINIDTYPIVFGMLAVEDNGERQYLPVDTFPLDAIVRITNHDEGNNYIGVGR